MRRLRTLAHGAVVAFHDKAERVARVLRVPAVGPRAAVLALKVILQVVLANAVAGFFVAAYLTLTEERDVESWPATALGNAVIYVVMLTAFAIAAVIRGRTVFAASWRWLDHEGGPTPEERRALLEQPVRLGVFPFKYWILGAIATGVIGSAIGQSGDRIVVILVAVLQGGLIACALGYLAGERALRPALAEALAGEPPDRPATVGLTTRLLLAWALGSGIPFLGIVLTPLLAEDLELSSWVPMAFLGITGLFSGAALTLAAALSIIGPVHRVRDALQRVADGDLEVEVTVDDGGQLGELQAGVNELVGSLRERRRLEDLFGRHVGTEVARRALERGVQLGGDTALISALFVDIVNSTELARVRRPSEVVDLLNCFFDTVVACTDAEGGWVDKFAGDAALCVFGVPEEVPDHATRCLRAGRHLAQQLAELRQHHPELDAGIGLASGRVVAGHVGTERRLEFTVIGPPVNAAARLSVAAKERRPRVLADEEVIRCAAGTDEAVCWAPAGTVDLKGLAPGLPVWEPVG